MLPGYGFLSENPELAEACARAGITFVGPPAAVLELTGNKARAIAAAREAGLPVLGSTEPTADVDEVPTDPAADPAPSAELVDSASMAALLLLARLSPLGGAVCVLGGLRLRLRRRGRCGGSVGGHLSPARGEGLGPHRQQKTRFEVDRQAQDVLATRFFDAVR